MQRAAIDSQVSNRAQTGAQRGADNYQRNKNFQQGEASLERRLVRLAISVLFQINYPKIDQ